jgi:hypothetical protein
MKRGKGKKMLNHPLSSAKSEIQTSRVRPTVQNGMAASKKEGRAQSGENTKKKICFKAISLAGN